MAFPDSGLKEILALADYAHGPVATDVFQYVAEYLVDGRALPGEPQYRDGLALLRRLRPVASPVCKARLASRLKSPAGARLDLVLLLLEDEPTLWRPLLDELRLEQADWLELAARAPAEPRAHMASRADIMPVADPPPARQEVFLPARAVDETVDALSDEARRRGLALSREAEPGLGPVVGDVEALAQALLRLALLACETAGAGERLVLGVRSAGGGGLAYTQTRPAGLGAPRAAALRPVARLAERLGGQLVTTETQLVLFFHLPRAQPPRLVHAAG